MCEGLLAAVPLLAKHEQNPPSAEQSFSDYRGGEEQGEPGTFFYQFLFVFMVLTRAD